jgi:hypothetical protein
MRRASGSMKILTSVAPCCTEFSMDSLSSVVVSMPALIVFATRPTCAGATTPRRSKTPSASTPRRLTTARR